jgi:hypothetical protein
MFARFYGVSRWGKLARMKPDPASVEFPPDAAKAVKLVLMKGFKRPNRIIMLYWLLVGASFGVVGLYHVALDQSELAAACTVGATVAFGGMRHHVTDKSRHVAVRLTATL